MKNIKILLAVFVACELLGVISFAEPPLGADNSKSIAGGKASSEPRILELEGSELDLNGLVRDSQGRKFIPISDLIRKEKDKSGRDVDVRYNRLAKYFPENKNIAVLESRIFSDESAQGQLKIYREDGSKLFEIKASSTKGARLDYEDAAIIGDHYVITVASKYTGENVRELRIYDIPSSEVVFSTSFGQSSVFQVLPDEKYALIYCVRDASEGDGAVHGVTYKYDLTNKRLSKIMEGAAPMAFSKDAVNWVLANTQKVGKVKETGFDLGVTTFYFFKNHVLVGTNQTKQYETPVAKEYSINNKYFIFSGRIDRKMKGNSIASYKTVYYIFDAENGRSVAEGLLSSETIERYRSERV